MVIAVISDIVGSRRLGDRERAQRDLDDAVARVERDHPRAVETLRPTVGDEEQGVYAHLDDALAATLLLRLVLPEGLDVRFGIGIGEVRALPAARGSISEGPGWWAAREAIETVHALQRRAAPSARTWVVPGEGQDALMSSLASYANAYLLARDELVGAMSERTRRLVYGRCLGTTQRDLAAQEGITQPAVSQALSGAGASAVVEGFRALGQVRA